MQLTTDLSQLPPDVRQAICRRMQHEDKARYDLGVVEQRRLKQLHDAMPVGAHRAEIGPATMVLSRDQWLRAMRYYGQMIFMDPDFAPWLLKKNEDMRVRPLATKIQAGYRAPVTGWPKEDRRG